MSILAGASPMWAAIYIGIVCIVAGAFHEWAERREERKR